MPRIMQSEHGLEIVGVGWFQIMPSPPLLGRLVLRQTISRSALRAATADGEWTIADLDALGVQDVGRTILQHNLQAIGSFALPRLEPRVLRFSGVDAD